MLNSVCVTNTPLDGTASRLTWVLITDNAIFGYNKSIKALHFNGLLSSSNLIPENYEFEIVILTFSSLITATAALS